MNNNSLARRIDHASLLQKAKFALAKANTLPEILEIRNQSETIRQHIKRIGESLELQNTAAEIKLRAERRAGETLAKTLKRGGDPKSHEVTLLDLGVSKMQSSRWQAIASVPIQPFEEHPNDEEGEGTYLLKCSKPVERIVVS